MEKVLLIDGHSIISRAFFGIPRLSTGDGRPTNAVYGFMNILLKVLSEETPDRICVAFDLDRKKLRRTAMYADYKGTRKPMPEELHLQVPVVQQLLVAMQVPVITLEGYEADDILGTLAKKEASAGNEVIVLSGDRDLLQLAEEHIQIMIPKTSKGSTEVFRYFPEDVKNEYGVTPTEFIDVKALMGDTSDNIPGLPGVGEKTAAEIIRLYGSIENAYVHANEVKPPRAANAFQEHYDLAVLSKQLATIDTDSPVERIPEKGFASQIYTEEAVRILRDLELKTLAVRFSSKMTGDREKTVAPQEKLPEFKLVTDPFQAEVIFGDCESSERFGLSFLFSEEPAEPQQLSLFETQEESVSLSGAVGLCLESDRLILIKSSEKYPGSALKERLEKLFRKAAEKQIRIALFDYKKKLRSFPALEDCAVTDVALASYLLNPLRDAYTFDTAAKDHLNLLIPGEKELLTKGVTFDDRIPASEAYIAFAAAPVCRKKLEKEGMSSLYDEVELPLCRTLAHMEETGIRTDRNRLDAYSAKLKEEIVQVEEKIHALAEEKFNINSPLQLGNILFEKLKISGGKKTKKGYSTSADILEKIRNEHPIIPLVLRYRTLTKLSSTYAEGLKAYISGDGRIHGTFHQTVTATGRISSADPNLQNIPVRTEEGRELRKVFIPEDGYCFVDADYSQVELRILASLSGDENLIRAYRDSLDIHTLTAARVFHVEPEDVTPEMRRNAKAVNFGIVYGISAFGLGEDLSISRKEALDYINTYFATYPGVKSYLDRQVKEAKEKGYITTCFGRRRPVPELRSSNFMERSFGERVAMNSPIQGTAADIMKIAMNRVEEKLKGTGARIVLQVHDELLVEVPKQDADMVAGILKTEMEHAADLPVPLSVDVNTGADWNECH